MSNQYRAIGRVGVLLLAATTSVPAAAQVRNIDEVTVYIRCTLDGVLASEGSGVLVSGNGLVLTAKHVAPDERYVCEGARGTSRSPWRGMDRTSADTHLDALLLSFAPTPEEVFPHVGYCPVTPELKQSHVTAAGFFPDASDPHRRPRPEPSLRPGTIASVRPDAKGWIEITAQTTRGMSGGPVLLDSNGSLIGIVAGASYDPGTGQAQLNGALVAQAIATDLGLDRAETCGVNENITDGADRQFTRNSASGDNGSLVNMGDINSSTITLGGNGGGSSPAEAGAGASGWTAAEILEAHRDAMVQLVFEWDDAGGSKLRRVATGFLVSADGLVLTAKHSVEGMDGRDDDYTILGAIGSIENGPRRMEVVEKGGTDIMLLSFRGGKKDYSFVRVCANNVPKVGERLVTLGFPEDEDLTVVDGLLSSMSSTPWKASMPVTYGSSGAPVFAEHSGRLLALVMGVNAKAPGIGLLMPIHRASSLLQNGGVDLSPCGPEGPLPQGSASRSAPLDIAPPRGAIRPGVSATNGGIAIGGNVGSGAHVSTNK